MKRDKQEAKNKKEKPLKVVIYMRVGSVEQLSPEAQQKYFGEKAESVWKGEECNADSNSEKEKHIGYTIPAGI